MDRRGFLMGAGAAPLMPARTGDGRVRIGFLGGSHSHAGGKVDVVLANSDYELVGMVEDAPEVRARYESQGSADDGPGRYAGRSVD